MKTTLTTYSLAALTALFLFGCRSSTEPSTGGTVTVVHPGVGSSYTYHSTTKDSTGAVTSENDYTMQVTAVNVAEGGRTDAIQFVDFAAGDTTYYAIRSNGDMLIDMGDPSGMSDTHLWVTLPFSGGAGQSATVIDTTADFTGLGIPMHLVANLTTTASGSESVTAAGKSFNARKAKLVMNVTMSMLNQSATSTIQQTLWMAPEIGNLVKMDQPTYKDATTSQTQDSRLDLLTSYTLK